MFTGVLPACKSMYVVYIAVGRGGGSSGYGGMDGCEPPGGCWELNSGPERVASALNW